MNIVRGACGHDCPDTCSWIVEVRDGTAEKLSGDPAHPFTRGTLCAKVNHYLDRVYHSDRVLHPLKRVGRKGEARFERVSWDEALGDIASRWKTIVDESGAEAILPHSSAGVQGVIQQSSLDRRLLGSMGCSDLDRNICGAVAEAGLTVTIGTGTGIDPEEVVHSRYIVLWGTNTIVTNLHFWPLVREAQSRGARLVVVDPIRTRTAEAADWHLQIRPGSDAALALAMMHVIVRDDLVDHDYVSRYAVGYDALVERVQQYTPERVADTVGLPAADIERFAREYATTTPSLLRPLIGIEHHRNGAMQFRALGCLPVSHRSVEASRRRSCTLHSRAALRRPGDGPRRDAGGLQARRSRAEHARHRQRSLQSQPDAAGSFPHRLRRQPDGVDAESEPDS